MFCLRFTLDSVCFFQNIKEFGFCFIWPENSFKKKIYDSFIFKIVNFSPRRVMKKKQKYILNKTNFFFFCIEVSTLKLMFCYFRKCCRFVVRSGPNIYSVNVATTKYEFKIVNMHNR